MKVLSFRPSPPFDFQLIVRQGWTRLEPWKFDRQRLFRTERMASGKIVTFAIESDASKINVWSTNSDLDEKDIGEIKRKLEWCLAVNEDLRSFYEFAKSDRFLRKAVSDMRGYRILCDPTVFESAVKAVCNQNTSFRMTRLMVRNLVEKYGEGAFPSRRTLIDASIDGLETCKLGYRAKYVQEVSRFDLEILKNLPTEEAKETLLKVKGIGSHTSGLILQRGLRRYDSFFIDLWVRRLIGRLYFNKQEVSDDKIGKYAEKKWGSFRGLALQYLLMDMKNL